ASSSDGGSTYQTMILRYSYTPCGTPIPTATRTPSPTPTATPATVTATPTRDPACVPAWQVAGSPNPGTLSDSLNAVAVIAANDVWAVGSSTSTGRNQTLTMHW